MKISYDSWDWRDYRRLKTLKRKAMCEDMADQLEKICETLASLPKRTDRVRQANMLIQDAIKELRHD